MPGVSGRTEITLSLMTEKCSNGCRMATVWNDDKVQWGLRFETRRLRREIESSGFPGIRSLGDRTRRAQFESYLPRALSREIVPERIADLVILTTGEHASRRRDGVDVVPPRLLGP